jgi:hypothetical protein
MLAQIAALGREDDVRVVQSPDRTGLALGDPHDGIDPRAAAGGAECVDRRAGNLDRLLEQAGMPRAALREGPHEDPVREARDEALRQRDDVGSVPPGLLDQLACLLGRGLAVEPDRRVLDGRGAEGGRLGDHVALRAVGRWRKRQAVIGFLVGGGSVAGLRSDAD